MKNALKVIEVSEGDRTVCLFTDDEEPYLTFPCYVLLYRLHYHHLYAPVSENLTLTLAHSTYFTLPK